MSETKQIATLPNCDQCGRFTSRPVHLSECIGIDSGYLCMHLLLCPGCGEKNSAAHRARENQQ